MRILDLFCGAGGASAGYAQAGHEVVGIDVRRQPRYPFQFHQADALDVLAGRGPVDPGAFDLVHASPPCQPYTRAGHLMRAQGNRTKAPDLVAPVLSALLELGRPWVLENVEGAPLPASAYVVTLCGSMFGLEVRRHRLFAASALVMLPGPCDHAAQGTPVGVYGRPGDQPKGQDRSKPGRIATGGRIARDLEEGRRAMGVDWMLWDELREAIPPAYTAWIAERILGQ